jgi:hypothetical protein
MNGRIYLLASRSNGMNNALLQWDLDPDAGASKKPRLVMEDNELRGLFPLGDKYIITTDDNLVVREAVFNDKYKKFSFEGGIYADVDIAVNSPLTAAALINRLNVYSIAVVDGLTGQYIFNTPTFYEIYSLQLWGRFLFVLAKEEQDGAVEFFGYDIKEKIDEPRK